MGMFDEVYCYALEFVISSMGLHRSTRCGAMRGQTRRRNTAGYLARFAWMRSWSSLYF
jgi:hypothetical protein